jgi:uncharacterized protein with PQ loop repeat
MHSKKDKFMTIFTKILASIGLFMLYGLLNQLVIMGKGREGPSMLGFILAIGFLAGVISIWRSKKKKDITSDKLDKSSNGPV